MIDTQNRLDYWAEIELAALEDREVEHDCGRVPNPEDGCKVCTDLWEAKEELRRRNNLELPL